jgi:ubiquinone/menaquinone biosynthesis C-methylase UbiE
MYREEIILPLVKDKDVLDCGGIDHWAFALKESRGDWLHALVAREARSCLGLDILADRVAKINEQGRYKFIVANAESLEFREAFDVVVAGEFVEHIYNVGLFLDSAWKALRPEGVLVVTTPNSYGLSIMLQALFLGRERCHPEHTCYYSPQTLSYVVGRHGFRVERLHLTGRPARWKAVAGLRRAVSRISPILSDQLVLVARKLASQDKYTGKW